MIKNSKNYIFFDFDGTLLDSFSTYLTTIWEKVVLEQLPLANKEQISSLFSQNYGGSVETILDKFVDFFSIDREQTIKSLEIFRKDLTTDKFHLYDDSLEFLKYLKSKGKYIAIISNNSESKIIEILSHYNALGLIDKIISCHDLGLPKPNPKTMIDLLAELNISKEDAIYYGDTDVDIEFAKGAGVDFMIFDHKLHEGKLFTNLVNTII